ncbi:MAG: Na(+)-translocating NADH-quinone reductase subunit C [Bacteroidota bacterium]
MALNTEKNGYTVLFAVLMVIVVGAILASFASGLRPQIDENERFAKQKNILYAMGVHENTEDSGVNFIPTERVEEAFTTYIKEQYVLNNNGEAIEDDQAYLIDLKKEIAALKKGEEATLPFFIGEKDGQRSYILPMYGKGLWDAIWGFMALDENLVVQGVYFDHKGETAGLGANIKLRFFMDDFSGESVVDGNQYKGILVAKGNNDPLNEDKTDYEVDALAGATITGNGVSAMIKESLNLYKPYLQTIRTN